MDRCKPFKDWQLIYSYDPTAGLTKDQAKLVLGSEVAIWSETIDEHSLDALLWPRASALSEVLWTGRVQANGQNRTQSDAAARLVELRERMLLAGVQPGVIQTPFCSQLGGIPCEMSLTTLKSVLGSGCSS